MLRGAREVRSLGFWSGVSYASPAESIDGWFTLRRPTGLPIVTGENSLRIRLQFFFSNFPSRVSLSPHRSTRLRPSVPDGYSNSLLNDRVSPCVAIRAAYF